ncbi:aldehyde dehydrogenase family protein [Amycolatopsis sp.]|uniref:aldehyde dehydrogenase family protein n=1 Tax=Amycolatopsis sp. TaxID=37632 RepID=UPI002CA910E6|nr:aldehyde dehydrogenase family protein [Amycolatopsis sp.]HVV08211.1 aldehyde dehydrogenase family protein [Amycolatopsis sp.]
MTASTAPRTHQGEERMLVDGELTGSASGARYDNINPATEEVLGHTAAATAADMDRAIAAARRAFDETTWSTDHAFRARCLEQLDQALHDEQEALRAEIVAEAGAPITTTYIAQLDWPLADALAYPAALIKDYEWERPLPDTELFGAVNHRRVVKEATGVVAAITPWNFPFEVVVNKIAPALAAGNTVVLKPAPDTPWTATRIGRLVAERTDIPAGVFNVVTTPDTAVAEQLLTDPRVDLVSFTGSTATGRRIVELSAATMKRTVLELGGKSAMIVLDDADFAATVPQSMAVCMHAGQGCALNSRLLVPRARYAEAVEIATATFGQVPYGDPTDPANFAGPLINARQHERVLGYLEKGRQEGARVTVGGGQPEHLPKGFYVQPTVFADVDNGMTIAREEIFGPVLVVIPFDDDAGAVRIANDSPYGLAGSVFSADDERADRVARRIRAGSLMVNGGMFYGADAPFGGYKQSGIGRQNGREGLEQYLETKTIGSR